MEFDYTKVFKGGRGTHTKSVVGIEELGRIFGGSVKEWSRANQLDQYSKSLYVFAAVNKIATKVADVELRLYKIVNNKGESQEILNHEILDLLMKINPFQTRTEFLKTAWINKKLTGEAFWLKVRNNRGQVVELWNLRPDLITVVSDSDSYIKHYELNKLEGGKEIFQPEDIIHFKDPDPLNPFRGMSPLIASKARIETEKSASEYQRDFFKNNARPDALLITEQQLDGDQRTQMTSAWEERHQGKGNEGRIGILEGGMKYQQVSISQREMDFIESMKFTRDDILVALGVPKSVITTDEVNYNNANAGIRMFLSETIAPEMSQLVEVLNEFLVSPDFGEQFFLDNEDPTPADREAQRKDSLAAHARWMTVNEIRAEYNLPPIEGGDVIAAGQTANPDGAADGTSEGMKQVVYRTTDEVRNKALRLLQGRPFLRKRFELVEQFNADLKKALAKKATTKKVTKAEQKKADKKTKEWVSILGEDETLRLNYANMVNKRIDNRAKSFERVLITEFAGQRDRVLKRLEALDESSKGVYTKLNHAQINSIMDKAGEARLFSAIALPFLLEFAEQGGEDAGNLSDETFDMTDQLRDAMEKRSDFFANSVTDTTFQSLVTTLAEGVNAGEGIADLAKRVRGVYKEIPKWRASLIARTETTNANNEGILESFRLSGVVKGKEWVNAGDARVRDEHQNFLGVGGEIKPVNEPFSNGLMFPSEPNCRCVIAPALYK